MRRSRPRGRFPRRRQRPVEPSHRCERVEAGRATLLYCPRPPASPRAGAEGCVGVDRARADVLEVSDQERGGIDFVVGEVEKRQEESLAKIAHELEGKIAENKSDDEGLGCCAITREIKDTMEARTRA
jgi:hypothetical protein